MNYRLVKPYKQSGIALLALLIMLILAGSYAFYRNVNFGTGRTLEKNKQFLQLIKAKESLIAYAVIDSTRPGRLPCPDLLGNGISPILSRDDCDAYDGYLPWKTLDLPEGTDFAGTLFRYRISPLFGGDRLKPVLNSETETTLRLDVPDPSASNDIAALIIAPRGTLDTRNDTATDYLYSGHSDSPDDNDLIVAVTRRELMAAVEQRIANQTRTCLQEHATSVEKFCRTFLANEPGSTCPDLSNPDIENPLKTYPWAAALSNNIYKGVAGSLFGMIPDTQPGNPEKALKQSLAKLTALKKSLESASTAETQVFILKELMEKVAYTRGLFDRIYIAAEDLYQKATVARGAFNKLNDTIVKVTNSNDEFLSDSASLPGAIQESMPSLGNFREALSNLGLDVFLMEAQDQTLKLQTKINAVITTPDATTLGALQTQSNVFMSKIFAYAVTPNPELKDMLVAGLVASTMSKDDAKSAKEHPEIMALTTKAVNSASTLQDIINFLIATLQANRISEDGREFNFQAEQIRQTIVNAAATPDAIPSLIRPLLAFSHSSVTLQTGGAATVIQARTSALNSIFSTLEIVDDENKGELIQASALQTTNSLDALAAALSNNGDNITLESLKTANNTLSITSSIAPKNQAAGKALLEPIKGVIYWADTGEGHAREIARLSRKGVTSEGDNANSAYTAARKFLASLDGATGSINLLEKFIKDSSAANQSKASTGLTKTKNALETLLTSSQKLDDALETSLAEAAVPTLWYGDACNHLKPPTGSETWWKTHQWNRLFFYQLSNRTAATEGHLRINGKGKFQTVVLSAGKALPGQDRLLRQTVSYLEGKNPHQSRDGNGTSPIIDFSNNPATKDFNDRVAAGSHQAFSP